MTQAVTAAGWLLLHGSPTPPPARIELKAGPVTAEFVPDLTHLRHIRIGGKEILRGIYAAVRDRNWGTIPQKVRITEKSIRPDQFHIAFTSDAERDDIRFEWKGAVTGSKDGTITYTFDGEAQTGFKGNRIGLLALHPPSTVCGIEATAVHPDGTKSTGTFPQLISPDVPFANITELRYDIAPGVTATLTFEGDTFGMEDQRNWTDDSFKTYSMMHGAKLPAEFKPGMKIRQSITIRITGTPPATPPEGPVILDADPAAKPSVLPMLKPFDQNAPVPRSFTDLSFNRPAAPFPDVISFSAHPQIHQFDDETIMENAATLATCVRTAKSFAPNARIAVGPLALNSAGSTADPRQPTLLCAAWTLSALKAVAESGAAEAAFFESDGPRGIRNGSRTFPCAHILLDAADSKGWRVLPAQSSRPLDSAMLLLEHNGTYRAFIANLTPDPISVRIVIPGEPKSATLRRLELSSVERAMTDPDAYRNAPGETIPVYAGAFMLALDRYTSIRLEARP